MPLRLSTGLRNGLNDGKVGIRAAVDYSDLTYAAYDSGGPTAATITTAAGDFVAAGIKAGDKIMITGSTDNDGIHTVTSLTTTVLTMTGDTIADEGTANANGKIDVLIGGSWKDILRDGVLRIYTGSQPTAADDGETGSQVLEITISSGTFTPGSPAAGLNFGTSTAGVINKSSSEIWSGVGMVNGTAGWFRFYANDRTTGSSATAIRFDGACATSGGQLNMSSTSIVSGATTTIDSFNVTLPASSV